MSYDLRVRNETEVTFRTGWELLLDGGYTHEERDITLMSVWVGGRRPYGGEFFGAGLVRYCGDGNI